MSTRVSSLRSYLDDLTHTHNRKNFRVSSYRSYLIWHTHYRMSPIISSLISYLKNLTQTYLDELDDVFILQMFLLVILQEFPELPLPQTAVLIGLHPCTVSHYTGHCQGITDLPSLLVVFGQVISTISGYYTWKTFAVEEILLRSLREHKTSPRCHIKQNNDFYLEPDKNNFELSITSFWHLLFKSL